MKQIPAHIERIIVEKTELDDKIHALRKFIGTEIYASLGYMDRNLLIQQLYPMQQYSDTLAQRLTQFYNPEAYGQANSALGCVDHHPV